ncbi:MAG: hypothetical protein U9R13_07470 [Campylobacterota bacterium]|nr:hypothetical protein [Campylobacterota bacterium]
MNKCDEIKANVRMEERYAGISLTFNSSPEVRTEIETAIKKIKKQTGMTPQCFDNSKDKTEASQAIYVEFSDDVQRDSGAFFELLLRELKIDKCVHDVVEK